MKKKIYLSACEQTKNLFSLSEKPFIYTENMREADYVLIEKRCDGTFSNAQFKDLILAKELGKRVGCIAQKKDREKQIQKSRFFLDADVGLE